MKFTFFAFKNFKGIEDQRLDLSKSLNSKVFTLVGLNESGKTTILEAINYFIYKQEKLDALNLENLVSDIHNLIPINKRDNFNGCISIQAGLEMDHSDLQALRKMFKDKHNIQLTNTSSTITYTQNYYFKNSTHQKERNEKLWSNDFKGIKGKSKFNKKLSNAEAIDGHLAILSRIPSILYFPNFLFDFPDKIYLEASIEDKKDKFFQTIIQDVLDSLGNDTNLQEHLIDRINSADEKEKRNLNSLIGKMQKQLTDVIFNKWNQILNKKISKIEVILFTGTDEKGSYLEFNIKDDVDTYRIIERSLGFRWFFVYILLTQFRSFRRNYNNVFFLFDEPASNLHPSAQAELLKSFEKLPNVLYTTHSHYLINPKWLESTFVIKNEAIDYNKEEEYNLKNTDVRIHKYREFAVNHPNQSNYFQPILEVLDYRPANLELIPDVIITEGKNDFYTFSYIQQVILNEKNPLKIIPGSTANNMESLISLYLGWGSNFLILLDSDVAGLKQKKRYEELFGLSIVGKVVTYQDIDSKWEGKGSENLFTKSEQLHIQKKCYPLEDKFSKKLFNRSIQECYIGSHSAEIGKQTLSAFQKTIEFLKVNLGLNNQ